MYDATVSLSLSLADASIIQRLKEGYLIWIKVAEHIPKEKRYTIGSRIENTFLDALGLSHAAYVAEKGAKLRMVIECVRKLDSLKFLVQIAWELKLISHKEYGILGEKLEESGRMLGGWKKNIETAEKKNRP